MKKKIMLTGEYRLCIIYLSIEEYREQKYVNVCSE